LFGLMTVTSFTNVKGLDLQRHRNDSLPVLGA
jgi:hypothetical protein